MYTHMSSYIGIMYRLHQFSHELPILSYYYPTLVSQYTFYISVVGLPCCSNHLAHDNVLQPGVLFIGCMNLFLPNRKYIGYCLQTPNICDRTTIVVLLG